jgi:hypothetical protein
MDYYYQDQLRLQLFGGSPNVTAPILLFAAFVILGILGILRSRLQGRKWLWAAIPGYFLVLCLLEAMLLTYSRGGLVSLAAAVALLARKQWRLLLPLLVPFVLLVTLTPSGFQRIRAVGDLQDASVGNRLVIWYNASGMILDKWAIGTQDDGEPCGTQYCRWYQPLSQGHSSLRGLVNGYLTVMGDWGMPLAFFAFWAEFTILVCALHLGFRKGSVFFQGIAAGLLCFAVGDIFSTLCTYTSVQVCLALAALSCLSWMLLKYRREFPRLLPWSALAAALPLLVVLAVGCVAKQHQYYHKVHAIVSLDGERPNSWQFLPTHPNGRWILHLTQNINDDARECILPVCQAGYELLSIEADNWSPQDLRKHLPFLLALCPTEHQPPILMISAGGLLANVGLQEFCQNPELPCTAIVAWDPIWHHPMKEYTLEGLTLPPNHGAVLVNDILDAPSAQDFLTQQPHTQAQMVNQAENLPPALDTLLQNLSQTHQETP